MNRTFLSTMAIMLVFLSACDNIVSNNTPNEKHPYDEQNMILIRVENDNEFGLANVTINNQPYGNLSLGQISRFIAFEEIQNNELTIEFIDNGQKINITSALDSTLVSGFYTLRIDKIHTGEFKNELRFSYGFKDPNHKDDPQKANVRILNDSNFSLENVVVEGVNYGTLEKGDITSSKFFDLIYRNAYIELYIDDDFFSAQPVDHVGQAPLDRGFYTFKLNVNVEAKFVIVEVIVN